MLEACRCREDLTTQFLESFTPPAPEPFQFPISVQDVDDSAYIRRHVEGNSVSYMPGFEEFLDGRCTDFVHYQGVPRSRVLLDTRLIHDSWRTGCRDERTKARGGFGGGRP